MFLLFTEFITYLLPSKYGIRTTDCYNNPKQDNNHPIQKIISNEKTTNNNSNPNRTNP